MWLSLFHPQTERLFQTYGEILDFWTLMYEVHEIWIEYGIFFEQKHGSVQNDPNSNEKNLVFGGPSFCSLTPELLEEN